MAMMTKTELVEAGYEITGGSVKDMTLGRLRALMTVTQYVTDLCLNEIERRGALTRSYHTDAIIVPYQCEYMVPTVLTRDSGSHRADKLTNSKGAHLEQIGFDRFERILNVARKALDDENPEASADELEEIFLARAGF
jgi:hypothetical protein